MALPPSTPKPKTLKPQTLKRRSTVTAESQWYDLKPEERQEANDWIAAKKWAEAT